MKRKGFTLIELLIVVAIIAILAAIAVPNFLEAQVRSKVSRCKADLRTLATAIEAYAVDENRPPLSNYEAQNWAPTAKPFRECYGQYALTTPIAYITTLPKDPFQSKGAMTRSASGTIVNTISANTLTFRYEAFGAYDKLVTNAGNLVKGTFNRGYTWVAGSWGPSRRGVQPPPSTQWVTFCLMLQGYGSHKGAWVYDPSNGTISYGHIMRTNKGEVTGGDFAGLY